MITHLLSPFINPSKVYVEISEQGPLYDARGAPYPSG
jgi:hypothetical protein